jgi:hypothetical protein
MGSTYTIVGVNIGRCLVDLPVLGPQLGADGRALRYLVAVIACGWSDDIVHRTLHVSRGYQPINSTPHCAPQFHDQRCTIAGELVYVPA